MKVRVAIWLLCAAAVILIVAPYLGSDDPNSDAMPDGSAFAGALPAHPASGTPRAGASADSIAIALHVELEPNRGATFALTATNPDDHRVELRFPNGQTHEFVVLDSTGREIWRSSEGRLFTQALQNKLLRGHETASYAEHWEPANPHGAFTVIGTLRSSNHHAVMRADFRLR